MSQQGRLGTAGGATAETLTGDTGGPVSPDGANNINIVGGDTITVNGNPGTNTLTIDAAAGSYPISPFIVGPVGQAGYQTIQDGLDAADAAGGGTVYVQPGLFAENLTLYSSVDLSGAIGVADSGLCTIVGVHTPPISGPVTIRNIFLFSTTDIFNSASAGTAAIFLIDVGIVVTNGFTFNLPNWTGEFSGFDIRELQSTSPDNGFINNTAGATVLMTNATIGAGTGQTMVTSGPIDLFNCTVVCPVDFQTGTIATISGGTLFQETLTFSNDSTAIANNSSFSPTSGAGIDYNSSGNTTITTCSINSSNNPSIDGTGAGTLTLTGIDFSNDSNIAGTLTLAAGNSYSGTYKSDYTDHGVILGQGSASDMVATAAGSNGQILIGGTGVDPVFNDLTSTGGTITVTPGSNTLNIDIDETVATTFDVDNGANVSPTANIIELMGTGTFTPSGIETHNGTGNNIYFENRRWLSPFVVDPSTVTGERGTFSTIASAILAAAAAGGGLIYIRAGMYVENLTLVDDVHLFGIQTSLNNDVQIDGTMTADFTGVVRIESIFFLNAVGGSNIIVSTAGIPQLSFSKCFFSPTSASLCGSANASFILTFDLCGVLPGVTDIFDMSAGIMTFRRGNLNPFAGTLYQNILATGTAQYIFFEDEINHFMETQGTAVIDVSASNLAPGPNSAFNVNSAGSTITCYNSTINSTDASGDFAIGTGTFGYGDLVILGSAEDINATLTETIADWKPYCTAAATEATVIKGTVGFDSANFSVTAGFVSANAASETVAGVIEISTTAEAIAGTDDTTAITPAKLVDKLGVLTTNALCYGGGTAAAINWLAVGINGQIPIGNTGNPPTLATITGGTAITITNGAGSITVDADAATESAAGIIEIATTAEAIAGTDDTTAITPAKLVDKLGALTANGIAYGGGTTSAVNWLAEATNGQLPIGSTGTAPALTTLTAGNGITITNGAGTITIDSDNSGMNWTEVTGTTQAMAVDNGYIANNVALVTLTLPATAVVGDLVQVDGKGAGGWTVAQNAGQTIHFLAQDTTTGAGGSLSSTTQYDCLTLRCITADTDWVVETVMGNLTVV